LGATRAIYDVSLPTILLTGYEHNTDIESDVTIVRNGSVWLSDEWPLSGIGIQ